VKDKQPNVILCSCGCRGVVKTTGHKFMPGHWVRLHSAEVHTSASNKKRSKSNSLAMLARLNDPKENAKLMRAMRTKTRRRNVSKSVIARWKIPGYREKWLAAHANSEAVKEGYKKSSRTRQEQFLSGACKPPFSKGGFKNYSNGFLTTKKAGKVWYRSSWEELFIQLLDSSPLVKMFDVEPFPIRYKFEGTYHTYWPDFLVELKDGRKFLVEIKGDMDSFKRQNTAKFSAARRFCVARGIDFRLFTEKVNAVTELIQ
jgi:TnsA endonuclease N terminal